MHLKPYFYGRPNMLKFKELLSTNDQKTLNNLARFVDVIMKSFE